MNELDNKLLRAHNLDNEEEMEFFYFHRRWWKQPLNHSAGEAFIQEGIKFLQ